MPSPAPFVLALLVQSVVAVSSMRLSRPTIADRSSKYYISTRDTSAEKWQVQGRAIGAYEIKTSPGYDMLSAPMVGMVGLEGDTEEWKALQEIWHHHMKESFKIACEGVPLDTSCCGLIPDEDQRIKDLVPYLNKHWVSKVANEILRKDSNSNIDVGVTVDAFLWEWHNVTGKGKTFALLIRFVKAHD